MKITRVEAMEVRLPEDEIRDWSAGAQNACIIKVYTDDGIVGVGEVESSAHIAKAVIEAPMAAKHAAGLGQLIIGMNPLDYEVIYDKLYQSSFYYGRRAIVVHAISGIDIALWDIAGKHFGVPAYQLLGGKCRDKARVYYHVFGQTKEQLIDGIVEAKKRGFTAVGHLTPFLDEPREVPYFQTHVEKMRDAIETVGRYREVVGNDVDLCIEIHRRLTPSEAVVLARGIEQFHPFFYEDPILPDNFDAMALVAENIHIPIATGERLHTIYEFEMLLKRGAVQYVRPDVCMCGGITHAKKVAALAEAHHVGVVPHNPLSPVSTAACIQLAACIPNFALQEYPLGEGEPPKSDIVKSAVRLEKGFLVIPDTPGIGIELAEDAAEKYPPRPREVATRLSVDGSVVDQ